MVHSFIVLAHTDPTMCERLVTRLADVGPVHLHINATVDPDPFAASIARADLVRPAVTVRWGHWSLVEAVLRLARQALRDPAVETVTWVSGQHYPLMHPRAIVAAPPADRIALWTMPDPVRGKPEWRFTTRFRPVSPVGGRLDVAVNGLMRRLPPMDYRAILHPHRLYGGTAWWSLTRRTLVEMLDWFEREERIRRYFGSIVVPDECAFHTAVAAVLTRRAEEAGDVAPDPRTMTLGATTYVRWENNRPHPEDLTVDTVRTAAGQGWWFTRKFSTDRPELIEAAESCWHDQDPPGVAVDNPSNRPVTPPEVG